MATKKTKEQDLGIQESYTMPQDAMLERRVLGSIIFLGNKAFDEVGETVSASSFYREKHSIIFTTLKEMAMAGKPIGLLEVVLELKNKGELESVGGASYISEMCGEIATTTSLDYDTRMLVQYENSRKLITLCMMGAQMAASNGDVSQVLELLEKGITDVSVGGNSSAVGINNALYDFYDFILKLQNGDSNMYFSTGFKKLDEVLNGGFHNSNLIVFGGRPGDGKTAIALHFVKHALRQDKKVLYVNIEMTTNGIIGRMVSDDVNYQHMMRGMMTPDEMNQMEWNMSMLKDKNLDISSDCNSFSGIVSLARKEKRTKGLDFLVIDYLQLVESGMRAERRQLEIGQMTRRLKALSKELDIPILLLSQLNRPQNGVEKRAPRLENLRESGDIEQDADIVLFTYRPDKTDTAADGRPWIGRGEIIVAKNREGERDVNIVYAHDKYFKQFVDDGEDDPAWECGSFARLARETEGTQEINIGSK